ncbi:MAG: 50S ribosomal protein L6, partial [Wenzhouxiangellaceae bacterium]
MSRIASYPIEVPKGVEFSQQGQTLRAKGSKGELTMQLHPEVELANEDGVLKFAASGDGSTAMAGTMRALVNNMIQGVANGFEKKLSLVG